MKKTILSCILFTFLAINKLHAQAPFISYFTPTQATTRDTVSIHGFDFSTTTTVRFGDSLAASFDVVNNNLIKAVVGFCTPNAFMDVSVTTAFGTNARPGFQFIPTPYITSFYPTSAGLNDTVTIYGVNLDWFGTVKFGGVNAKQIIGQGATTSAVKVIVGNGASGSVSMHNSYGGSSLTGFTYAGPVIANFNFASASGSYFVPTTVYFINTSASSAPIISSTWTFGDGASSTLSNPQHVYTSPGSYQVMLVVRTASKADSVIRMIQIQSLIERNMCSGSGTFFTVANKDSGTVYQWQVSHDSANFVPLSSNANYSGVTTDTLFISNAPSSLYGKLYRCIVNSLASNIVYVITFSNTWTGAANTTWENPANWSCGTVPGSATDVIITSGMVVVNNNTTIRSLTISPGVTFTVSPGVVLTVLH